jgi:hypothetical protein
MGLGLRSFLLLSDLGHDRLPNPRVIGGRQPRRVPSALE